MSDLTLLLVGAVCGAVATIAAIAAVVGFTAWGYSHLVRWGYIRTETP
jgi:hypothetical protein